MTPLPLSRGTSIILVAAGLLAIPPCQAFLSPQYRPSLTPPSFSPNRRRSIVPGRERLTSRSRILPLCLSIDSNDPFQVLGMDEPTTDKKVIKRAYKRMALQYHPDVATTQQSTPQEKKAASDRFAKINWAYEVLSGKRQANDSTYGTPKASTTTSNNNGGGGSASSSGWTPPHRRSGPYSSPSGTSNTGRNSPDVGVDWTDFMPKNDDQQQDYDAGGDSFGKILSDLFVGAAAGAVGMGAPNVIKDFIEFLEGNVDGFGADPNDEDLRLLLRTGSLDEVRNELDDTELVVQQLTQKSRAIQEEIVTLNAKVGMTSRYMDKIEMEESLAELNARKDVVQGYAKKAQKRLLELQTRYKELLTGGNPSSTNRQSSGSSWDDVKREAGVGSSTASSQSDSFSSYKTGTQSDSTTASSPSTSSSQSQRASRNEEDSWMNEGFGSSTSGRGRGSGRRRSRSGTTSSTTTSTEERSSPNTNKEGASTPSQSPGSENRQRTTTYTSSSSSSSTTRGSNGGDATRPSGSSSSSSPASYSSLQSMSNVPPHRRTTTSYENRQEQDQRRMRELKVDDEFDKLKRELGL